MERTKMKPRGLFGYLLKNTDLFFTFGLFGIVLILILPVSAGLMDFLLAISIGLSLLVLLVVIYINDPPEFSVFPTILLSVTLYRLGLNVASTRLILLDGYAGHVIDSFGNFVVRGNYVVGAVVFLILVIINFVVITKGAGRIAEVAARFTLDAMPGKQMSIDAELNAGIIDEATATKRRLKTQKEADFYGSMDGASKFVRGDAVASILITLINIVGGITIGVFQKGLSLMDALEKYTLLSIGDGLVAQVPALIISVAAGILITRSSEKSDLGTFIGKQLTIYPRAVAMAGIMMGIFAFLPGMPAFPFLTLAGLCGYMALYIKRQGAGKVPFVETLDEVSEKKSGKAPGTGDPSSPGDGPAVHDFARMIQADAFSIELGYGLLGLTDADKGGDLLERITGTRKNFAAEMGMIVPPVAVRDNLDLEANHYRFLVRNKEVAKGEVVPNRWMAMNVSNSKVSLKGIPTVEPVFGLDAVWITEEERKTAEINGYTVVDASSVLITHLSEILRDVAHIVLEREDVQTLVDLVKEKNPTLVGELLPDLVSVGLIQRVLQNLLREHVSIKNLNVILETIADFASFTKNPDDLAEQVRKRLGIYFVQEFEAEPDKIRALTVEPRLEQQLVSRVKRSQFEVGLMMDPALTECLLRELDPRVNEMAEQGLQPVLVTTTELRLAFKRFFEPSFPRLAVLAYQEVPNAVQVQNIGVITAPLEELNLIPEPKNLQLATA